MIDRGGKGRTQGMCVLINTSSHLGPLQAVSFAMCIRAGEDRLNSRTDRHTQTQALPEHTGSKEEERLIAILHTSHMKEGGTNAARCMSVQCDYSTGLWLINK